MVPAGASCETRPGFGPGTAYFDDASPDFRAALTTVDFEHDAAVRSAALTSVLDQARPRDTLTLWHLLPRVNEGERVLVYERIEDFAALPAGVTREGVLKLDQKMLDGWRVALEGSWLIHGGKGKGVPEKSLKAWPELKLKDADKK